ncbi:MAG: PhnD/SsuA/transferrin family substrate-binding protein [Betaproteobacteria bacterium]|nr:PhnD/SsuA/transferrin family substrate-binding protein [Betaproteobacteria bacterium]
MLLCLPLLVACDETQTPAGPRYGAGPHEDRPLYHLAVHPLHNPNKLSEAYQPLVDHLNQQIPEARFKLESSRDYQNYEVKFRAREPALLLPNPWQTLEAMKAGYRVIAMAGDSRDFKGLFIVRKDSPVRAPSDLRGKAVSYPSRTALAACIMPQWYLHKHGLDVNRDIENRYVGSQESSIMNAYLGEVAVAATWPPPWRLFQRDRPQEAAQMKVLWETPPLLNNSVMVRQDVPAPLAAQIARVLHGLHTTESGKAILAGMQTARFHPANDAAYAPVREFVDRFEREVRKVESP